MTSTRENAVLIAKGALYDDGRHGWGAGPVGLDDRDIDDFARVIVRRLAERGFLRDIIAASD